MERRRRQGVKVGGWGHVLGDKGSGYDIGLRALQAVVDTYDHDQVWPELGRQLLRALQLNEPNDLIDWAQAADKTEIASLASGSSLPGGRKDRIAAVILADAARSLARDASRLRRTGLPKTGTPVQFVLTGSILLKQTRFAAHVGRYLRKLWPKAASNRSSARVCGATVELARRALNPKSKVQSPSPGPRLQRRWCGRARAISPPRNAIRTR